MRVILYTGKGGVGKTSVAAASALRCAELGNRTLIMSTDPAHSLGDSFDIELGPKPEQVAKNLWAHEVSALHEMEKHWQKLHDYAASVFATQGLDEVMAEEVATPPGMDEIASLMWIRHHAEKSDYDVLIVDCAPTGETLQLLTFPDAAKWWLDKIYPWERRAMKVARPMLQKMIDVPLPSDDVYVSLRELLIDLEGMKKLLTDTSITSVRIVLNLEKMVVKEAKRAYTYLSLFGYMTDAVIVNRILPEGLTLPILTVPLFDTEVVGLPMLSRMADSIYADTDPSQRLYVGSPQRIEKVGSEYVLALKLPFMEKSDIDLARHDGELSIKVGNYRREVSLPRVLASRPTLGAAMDGDELKVRFGVKR
jgi:arsenite-transporting ATPase